MPIPLGLQPFVQILQVLLQLLPVLLLRDPIHPHRPILADASVGPQERRHIYQMRQRVKPSFGFPLRSFHYLH